MSKIINNLPHGNYNNPEELKKINLLWENASPTSEFGEQTVSVDLSGYDLIFCTAKTDNTAATGLYLASSFVPNIVNNIGIIFEMNIDGWEQSRQFKITSNGISFSLGHMVNHADGLQYGDRTDRAIPVAIYGIKGVV